MEKIANESSVTSFRYRQHHLSLNHPAMTPIKQLFHRPPLRCTLNRAIYSSKCYKQVSPGTFSALFQWNFHCLQRYQVMRWQFTLSAENRKSCLHLGWCPKEVHRIYAWCHLSLKRITCSEIRNCWQNEPQDSLTTVFATRPPLIMDRGGLL